MRSLFKTLAALLLLVASANATLYTSVKSGDWSSSATWDQGQVPTATDDINIASSVTLSTTVSAASVTIAASQRLTINDGASLTATEVEAIGTIKGNGNLTVAGPIVVDSASSSGVRLQGTVSVLELQGDVNNVAGKYLEAVTVRLTGATTRAVNGIVQTNKYGVLDVSASQNFNAGTLGVSLGGQLNLNGNTVTVNGGNVVLVGSQTTGGSIVTTTSGSTITITPASSTYPLVSGSLTLTTPVDGLVVMSPSKALDVGASSTLTITNALQLNGEIQGTNGTVNLNSVQVGTGGEMDLSGGGSFVSITGDILNDNQRDFEADVIVLSSSVSRTVSGYVQTMSGELRFGSSQALNGGNSPISLGGMINLQGYLVSVPSGNLTLNGQGIYNGAISCNNWILVNPSSTTYTVGTGGVTMTAGSNSWIQLLKNKRIDVSNGLQATFNNLYIDGQLRGTDGLATVNNLYVSTIGSIYMSGDNSQLTLTGSIDNENTGYQSLQANIVVLSAASGTLIASGMIQSLKTGSLVISSAVTLMSGSSAIQLGGVIDLGSYQLLVQGTQQVTLAGNGITAAGGSLVTTGADIVISPPSTSFSVTGTVTLQAATGNIVSIVSNHRITVQTGATLTVSPQLLLNGGTLEGTGHVIVTDVVTSQVGNAIGGIKMDLNTAQLDVLGNIDNTLNGVFYAAVVRLIGAFTRTIRGTVQTKSQGIVLIGCTTTLQSGSSASLGGQVVLNGQTLNINDDIRLTGSALAGPGYIRYSDGCGCTIPTLYFIGSSSYTISGYPILQNVNVDVNCHIMTSTGSTLEVAGAKTVLNVNDRIQGSGNLRFFSMVINGPLGRVQLTATSSIQYVDPIVNNGVYSITGVVTEQPEESSSACEDAACLKTTLKDLARQLAGLTATLASSSSSGACANGNCPGWNADYTSVGCASN